MKTLEQLVAEAESAAHAARAGERQAMRGERKARTLWRAAADRAGLWERKAGKIIEQAREWKHRALEAEAEVEEGLDLVRDLLKDHYLEMREAQANAFQIICQVALQAPTTGDAAGEHPSILGRTISVQLDTICDQDERIDVLKDREQALLKDNSSLRSILADRSAEVNTLTQALDVCHSKLADAIGENTQLDESLADMRNLAEANGMNVNALRERLAEAESESTEVIRKCNEQLAAMAAAAKLRDQQVETLSRLWLAAFEQTGSPVGAVITRQLYRVMADHGVDVSSMPESHDAYNNGDRVTHFKSQVKEEENGSL